MNPRVITIFFIPPVPVVEIRVDVVTVVEDVVGNVVVDVVRNVVVLVGRILRVVVDVLVLLTRVVS
jgi:hypothetical protein